MTHPRPPNRREVPWLGTCYYVIGRDWVAWLHWALHWHLVAGQWASYSSQESYILYNNQLWLKHCDVIRKKTVDWLPSNQPSIFHLPVFKFSCSQTLAWAAWSGNQCLWWVHADYHLMIFSWGTKCVRLIMVVSQGQTSCPNYCERVGRLFSGFT